MRSRGALVALLLSGCGGAGHFEEPERGSCPDGSRPAEAPQVYASSAGAPSFMARWTHPAPAMPRDAAEPVLRREATDPSGVVVASTTTPGEPALLSAVNAEGRTLWTATTTGGVELVSVAPGKMGFAATGDLGAGVWRYELRGVPQLRFQGGAVFGVIDVSTGRLLWQLAVGSGYDAYGPRWEVGPDGSLRGETWLGYRHWDPHCSPPEPWAVTITQAGG